MHFQKPTCPEKRAKRSVFYPFVVDTYLLNSGIFSRSNKAECVVIFEGLNSEISSSFLRPIRLAMRECIQFRSKYLFASYQALKIFFDTYYYILHPTSLTVESRSTVGGDIPQSLCQDSLFLKTLNEYVSLPFGQFAAIFVHQKRQMSKGGWLPSKSAVHEKMFGGGDEPLRPTQHMADPHVMIIYYVSKMIGGKAICFDHHRVPLHLKKAQRV